MVLCACIHHPYTVNRDVYFSRMMLILVGPLYFESLRLKFFSEKWVVIISQLQKSLSMPPNSHKKHKTYSLSLFSCRNFIYQMFLLRGNLMSYQNLFQQTNTSVRSVLISYYRILSTRRVINNSCYYPFVVCPWTAQSWEVTAVSGPGTQDLTWQATNKSLSVCPKRRQQPKVQKEIPNQNETASFFSPKCLLRAAFRPASPGHFTGLPNPLSSSHSLGHLRLATDQYEQFLEKYDVSMTTKPQILSGRQWDQ